jgi:hypothetical protein
MSWQTSYKVLDLAKPANVKFALHREYRNTMSRR